MIDSVEIKNFRGIHYGKIERLSQVNLFFGKNNCGKSALLEGLFLICGQSNPLLPATINSLRSYNRISETDIRYFFYKMDDSKDIEIITSGSQERHLAISCFQEVVPKEVNTGSTEIPSHFGLRMKYNTKDGEYSSEIEYDVNGSNQVEQKARVDNRYSEKLKCLLLNPHETNVFMEGLQNIYLNKDEALLSESLRILEPAAKNPVFIDNIMFVDEGLPQRIPINLMGDGIRKMVSFLTCIYACRGGVVLIDELSNGFHYSVMRDMWKIVIKAAVKNDVQVFATTHDADSIRGFKQAAIDLREEIGYDVATGFKLQRITDDELKGYRFTVDQISYAMEQEIEVR